MDPNEPLNVTFSPEQLDALDFLLNLVHYDDLAKEMWCVLPDELLHELSQEFRSPEE